MNHTEHHNSLRLCQQALDSSNSGIIITDNTIEDNPIIYCNKAFENMTGYSPQEIIGHNCRFLQKNDRYQKARQQIKSAILDESETRIVIRNYKKNGDLFWNELFVSPVKDENGVTTHFIGVQNDITQQKETEHELREEKANVEKKVSERTKELKEEEMFLSSIIQTVRESLLVLDENFHVLSANNHFLKTFKVSSEETIGKLLYELGNHQWDIDPLKELLIKILPTSNPVIDFEVEHDFPYIGKKTMILNAYRIEFEGQYKDRILLAIEDVSERRDIEKRKDDFLSIASHELKTPLTTIKGLVQILQRFSGEGLSEKYSATLDKVAIHVDRLNNLITDLLDTSKIQSGNIESHKEICDISNVVSNCIDSFQISEDGHKINLSGDDEILVNIDESQITQVINNIIGNAVKYSPKSKPIYVNISKVGNFVKVSVKDEGLGISQNDKSRVFERFYRADSTQKQYPGMGIGLYVSQKIIDNHKGTIWVESEPNQGSAFHFTLPLKSK